MSTAATRIIAWIEEIGSDVGGLPMVQPASSAMDRAEVMPFTRKNLTAWLGAHHFDSGQSGATRRARNLVLTWSIPDSDPEDEDWDILYVRGTLGRTQKINRATDTNTARVYPTEPMETVEPRLAKVAKDPRSLGQGAGWCARCISMGKHTKRLG